MFRAGGSMEKRDLRAMSAARWLFTFAVLSGCTTNNYYLPPNNGDAAVTSDVAMMDGSSQSAEGGAIADGSLRTDSNDGTVPTDDAFTTVPRSYTYVLNTFQVPTPNAGVVEGFNHDGTAAAVCGKSDYTSPWGETGVDNAFAGGIGSLRSISQIAEFLDGFQTSINEGRLLLLVTVSDVNSLTNDSSVSVSAVYGYANTAPRLTDGRLSPGQTFSVDSESVTNMDSAMPRNRFLPGRIVNGVLEASGLAFAILLSTDAGHAPINLRATRVRARITTDALSEAALGGIATTSEVAAGISSALPEQFRALLPTIVAGLADSEPPTGTDENCAALSFAVKVTGVTAQLGSVVVRPAPMRDAGVPDAR